MIEEVAASASASLSKGSHARQRRAGTLEKARTEFAKLLRARIAERERELERLRAELSGIGGAPSARRVQMCSICGRSGHTKRTCSDRTGTQAE